MRHGRLLVISAVGLSVGLMILAGLNLVAEASPVAPASTRSGAQVVHGGDPIVTTNGWVGYGVRGIGAADTISIMNASWCGFSPTPSVGSRCGLGYAGPGFTCPGPPWPATNPIGTYSEVIGAGLNGGYGGRIDGVGTVAICILGSPTYEAWAEQGSALTWLPLTVHAADNFSASVQLGGWNLYDLTTHTHAWGTWSTPIPAKNRQAECIVGRGTSVLGLNRVFNSLPTTAGNPAMLATPVQFGDFYSGFLGVGPSLSSAGCWFLDPAYVGSGPPAGWEGIANPGAPGFVVDTFELTNPPPGGTFARLIVPGAPVTGAPGPSPAPVADDSFEVP